MTDADTARFRAALGAVLAQRDVGVMGAAVMAHYVDLRDLLGWLAADTTTLAGVAARRDLVDVTLRDLVDVTLRDDVDGFRDAARGLSYRPACDAVARLLGERAKIIHDGGYVTITLHGPEHGEADDYAPAGDELVRGRAALWRIRARAWFGVGWVASDITAKDDRASPEMAGDADGAHLWATREAATAWGMYYLTTLRVVDEPADLTMYEGAGRGAVAGAWCVELVLR